MAGAGSPPRQSRMGDASNQYGTTANARAHYATTGPDACLRRLPAFTHFSGRASHHGQPLMGVGPLHERGQVPGG